MLTLTNLSGFGGNVRSGTGEFLDYQEQTTPANPMVTPTMQFGAVAPAGQSRMLVACITGSDVGVTGSIPTVVTIGGISATLQDGGLDAAQIDVGSGDTYYAEEWAALVPAGTTGVVSVTHANTPDVMGVTLFRVIRNTNDADADGTTNDSPHPLNKTLSLPHNVAIACAVNSVAAATASWTAPMTEVSEENVNSLHAHTASLLVKTDVDANTAVQITFSDVTGVEGMVVAEWVW